MNGKKKVLLASILSILLVSIVAVSGNALAFSGNHRRELLIYKFRGLAIGPEGNVHKHFIKGIVGLGAVKVDGSVRFKAIKGYAKIDGEIYNITYVVGKIYHIRRLNGHFIGLVLIKGKALNVHGEVYNFTLLGRAIFSSEKRAAYLVLSGIASNGSNHYLLVLEGVLGAKAVSSLESSSENL